MSDQKYYGGYTITRDNLSALFVPEKYWQTASMLRDLRDKFFEENPEVDIYSEISTDGLSVKNVFRFPTEESCRELLTIHDNFLFEHPEFLEDHLEGKSGVTLEIEWHGMDSDIYSIVNQLEESSNHKAHKTFLPIVEPDELYKEDA